VNLPRPQKQQQQRELFSTTTNRYRTAEQESDPFLRIALPMKKHIQRLRHHARFGNIHEAEQELDQILILKYDMEESGELQPDDIAWECIRCIIRGCTRRLHRRSPTNTHKGDSNVEQLVDIANRLFERGKTNFPETTNENRFRSKFRK
jgi:hypothetical protein